MFQGPKGYVAQICEACSMKTVQQNGCLTLFGLIPLYTFLSNLFEKF